MSGSVAASRETQPTAPDAGAIALPAPATPSGGVRMLVTVCTVLATLMQSLDSTIANVALPYTRLHNE